jgi:hypothetical protein
VQRAIPADAGLGELGLATPPGPGAFLGALVRILGAVVLAKSLVATLADER